jgi:membrane protein DedA with SNARE-associated domain/rhodanese-related sulfurtransferase
MQHFLALLEQYGLLIIFGNVLLEQAGLPLPAYPLLLVTGALVGQGQFSSAGLLMIAVIAALIADLGWYYAGRRFGRRIMGKLCRISLSPDSCLKQTESIYLRIGPPALLFCKFIPGFASISSALAGSTGTRLAVFILFDTLGCAIWAGSAIWLGATFSNAIDELLNKLVEMGKWGAGLVLIGLAIFIALKWWERYRFLRNLRMARISATQLNELLERGETPVIVDTRAAHLVDDGWIPGARFVSLDKVNEFEEIDTTTPVILYCSCPNEVTAAQVAKRLFQRGFTNVRPLEGGIDAWIAAGYKIEKAKDTLLATVEQT